MAGRMLNSFALTLTEKFSRGLLQFMKVLQKALLLSGLLLKKVLPIMPKMIQI